MRGGAWNVRVKHEGPKDAVQKEEKYDDSGGCPDHMHEELLLGPVHALLPMSVHWG